MRLVHMAALALSLAACSSSADATQTLMSTDGLYHLELTLDPAEPVSGEQVSATVMLMQHEDMSAVTGATVDIEPFMPMHNHGIPDEVSVSEGMDGMYTAAFAFSMPGDWEVRIDVDGTPGQDLAVGTVRVQ